MDSLRLNGGAGQIRKRGRLCNRSVCYYEASSSGNLVRIHLARGGSYRRLAFACYRASRRCSAPKSLNVEVGSPSSESIRSSKPEGGPTGCNRPSNRLPNQALPEFLSIAESKTSSGLVDSELIKRPEKSLRRKPRRGALRVLSRLPERSGCWRVERTLRPIGDFDQSGSPMVRTSPGNKSSARQVGNGEAMPPS